MVIESAITYIKINEGEVKKDNRHVIYDDDCGKPCKTGDNIKGLLTVGYGRNLMGRGLSQEEAEYLLKNDVAEVYEDLRVAYPWFASLSNNRQIVMIDLRFNMGAAKLSTFKYFLKAMSLGAYQEAAHHLLDSQYAKQVGRRATQNAELIRVG